MVDVVWRLKRHRGKAAEYRGEPYMLLGARYKKVGVENVFGKEVPVVEARAELLKMGTNKLFDMPAEEVKLSNLKWDYINRKWIERTEQIALAE